VRLANRSGFRRFAHESKGKGVREIVKGCSLMKPDTASVTIVWSDEVQAFVIFCTISLCSLARRLSCPLSRFKLYSPGRRLPAAAMALKVGSYTRATKTAAYHRSGKLNLDVANII
jgi:hypothetical protein